MDKLQDYEVDAIIENLPYTDVNSWEQCRLQVYIVSQLFAKKKSNIKEILEFPWEKKEIEVKKTSISNEEIAQLEKMAEQIRKQNYG